MHICIFNHLKIDHYYYFTHQVDLNYLKNYHLDRHDTNFLYLVNFSTHHLLLHTNYS